MHQTAWELQLAEEPNASPSLHPVVFLGDSHVKYFTCAAALSLFSPRPIDAKEVGGATAVGMRNPNAMTNAIGKFRDFLKDRDRNSIVVTHLGEVDCGYVIWYRAQKYDESVEVQLWESLNAYFSFVDEMIAAGFRHIIVTGASLPTITDDDQIGEVVLKRSGIRATQIQRTNLTMTYNDNLRSMATDRGLLYTDISHDIIDSETGVVRPDLRNPISTDHHMNYSIAAHLWAGKLNDCFNKIDELDSNSGDKR